MPKKPKPPVLLSTVDGDLGIVPGAFAKDEAIKSAKEQGKTVTMRDPTTDEELGTAEPKDDEVWSDMFLRKETPKPVDQKPTSTEVKPTEKKPAPSRSITKPLPEAKTESKTMRTNTKTKLPVPPASKGRIARNVPATPVNKAELRKMAKQAIKESPVQRLPQGKRGLTKGKATPTARTPVKGTTNVRRASEGYKVPEKGSKVELVVQMASRKIGASRNELIEATGWTVAPWRWNFENPKGNGYCQRFGYTLESRPGKDGETRYFITKIK